MRILAALILSLTATSALSTMFSARPQSETYEPFGTFELVQDDPYFEDPNLHGPVAEEYVAMVIDALHEQCPLNADVQVDIQFIDAPVWGQTWYSDECGKYHIQVDSRQSIHSIVYTLLHEWAHAMVWDATQDGTSEGHGPMWGIAHAHAYRAFLSTMPQAEELQTEVEVEDPGLPTCGGVLVDCTE